MKKEYRLPILLLLLAVVVLFLIESARTKETDWSYSYYREHKKPFGLFLFHEAFKKMWPHKKVEYITVNFFEWARANNDSLAPARNLIIVNDTYAPDEEEAEVLLDFVAKGNTVFISTENIGSHLRRALEISEVKLSNVLISSQNIEHTEKESYSIERFKRNFQGAAPYGATFVLNDDASTEVLGKSIDGVPNFIQKAHGKGSLIINGTPAYFSNYGMLDAIDPEYVYSILSFLPDGHFIWNDYISTGFPQSRSPVRFLWSHPSLRWAYLLTLCFALLWVLFKAKRNQRVIPIVPVLKNDSIQFLTILSKVYFRKADHNDLARKKVKYFFEQLRSHLHLQITQQFDSKLIEEVASKAGYDLERTYELFKLIENVQTTAAVSETQLTQLHRAMSQFYLETTIYGKRTK